MSETDFRPRAGGQRQPGRHHGVDHNRQQAGSLVSLTSCPQAIPGTPCLLITILYLKITIVLLINWHELTIVKDETSCGVTEPTTHAAAFKVFFIHPL